MRVKRSLVGEEELLEESRDVDYCEMMSFLIKVVTSLN